MDTLGDLRVRLRDDWVDDKYSDQPSDSNRNESTAPHVQQRSAQVRSIGEHDRKHRAEDRGHQGRDDHGPDHGCRGVGSDACRGDDGCQRDQDPEPAQSLTNVGPLEEHRVAYVLRVVHHYLRVAPSCLSPASILHCCTSSLLCMAMYPRLRKNFITQRSISPRCVLHGLTIQRGPSEPSTKGTSDGPIPAYPLTPRPGRAYDRAFLSHRRRLPPPQPRGARRYECLSQQWLEGALHQVVPV